MKMTMDINVIIENEFLEPGDEWLFSGEPVIYLKDVDMYDILVRFGFFKSKSEARKNWKRTCKEIPTGFNMYEHIGRFNSCLTIWNPNKKIGDYDGQENCCSDSKGT